MEEGNKFRTVHREGTGIGREGGGSQGRAEDREQRKKELKLEELGSFAEKRKSGRREVMNN